MAEIKRTKTEFLKRMLTWGLLVLCTPLIGGGTYYSWRYSMQFIDISNESIIWETKDSLLLHLAVAAMLFVVLLAAEIVLKKCADEEKMLAGLRYAVIFITLCGSLIWVLNGNFYAQNDSRAVLECVRRMRSGDFSDLLPAGYLGGFQNQLGIAAIFRFFFRVLRTDNDMVLQVVNALCVPCIIYSGDRFLKETGSKNLCHVCYLIGMLFCFPLLFYTPYVYGEIISVTAGCFFILEAVCYMKRGETKSWIVLILSAVIGNLARGNFPVLLIAFSIIAGLYCIRRKSVIPAVCAVTVCFFAVMGGKACRVNYEYISGVELDQGIPIESWIAMGLNDSAEAAGMYNGYNVNTYAKHNYDKEAARKESLLYIYDRLCMLSGGEWKSFFKEKLLVQWNDPTLTCFMENRTFVEEPKIPAIMEIMSDEGKYYKTAVELMNQYQSVLYLGMLFYCIGTFRCKKPFYELLVLVVILGGFLFSLIWEAMARYVFPYIIYMIPLSAMGWCYMMELFKRIWLEENRRRKSKAGR